MGNFNDNCKPTCDTTTGPFTVDGQPSTGSVPNTETILFNPGCPPIPADVADISTWQLSNNSDACIINQYVSEALIIAGAPLNVYLLLGVHNQGKLVDVTGKGNAISNGDLPGFPASNAFDIFQHYWQSIQKGSNVPASAYIGYDFGVIETTDGSRAMYGVEANIRKHITTISIKQSANPAQRATVARLERSDDGFTWYGVGIIPLPDNDCLNTIGLKDSVPQRFWRLRPTAFNGGPLDSWAVQAFQMFDDYTLTNIDNIEDKIFAENRDRAYSTEPVMIKGSYDLLDANSELTKLGVQLPTQVITLQVNFLAIISALGRPLVIGDIIEMPLEAQFSAQLRRIQKWMEVTDVAWSTQGYTPGWHPTMIAVTLQPAMATQETQDLFGDLASKPVPGGLGLRDRNSGNDLVFQDYFDFSQTALADAKTDVPEQGAEGSGTVREYTPAELAVAAAAGAPHLNALGLNPTGLYVEDAIPPNNAPYTSGNTLPATGQDGEYFRVIYTGMSKDIPASLYRYSLAKGRWVFLEQDKRAKFNPTKPIIEEFLTSPGRRPIQNITK